MMIIKNIIKEKLLSEAKINRKNSRELISDALEVVRSYGVTIKVKKLKSNIAGFANVETHEILLSEQLVKNSPINEVISVIFHELGHIYCVDHGIFKQYHSEGKTEKWFKALIRTGLRAEMYVDKWAKEQMKYYYPWLKFETTYTSSKRSKEFLMNFFYDSYEDMIINSETDKLDKILREMGI